VEQGDDWATAICVDEDNCIYVTGSSESVDGDPDYLTLKYLPSGVGIKDTQNSKSKIQNSKLAVYPNPFKTQTTIRFTPHASRIALKIYDISGKLVKSFSTNNQPLKTNNCLVWNGTDDSGKRVPPGVYYIGLITQNGSPRPSFQRAIHEGLGSPHPCVQGLGSSVARVVRQ
jgi:hypothetical protein